jgi:hypothetical protein
MVPASIAGEFTNHAQAALAAVAACPGYVRGRLGRAVDDADRWVLVTEWDGAGSTVRGLLCGPGTGPATGPGMPPLPTPARRSFTRPRHSRTGASEGKSVPGAGEAHSHGPLHPPTASPACVSPAKTPAISPASR